MFVQAGFSNNMPSETKSKVHLVDLAGRSVVLVDLVGRSVDIVNLAGRCVVLAVPILSGAILIVYVLIRIREIRQTQTVGINYILLYSLLRQHVSTLSRVIIKP
jgi:hypothetical protein